MASFFEKMQKRYGRRSRDMPAILQTIPDKPSELPNARTRATAAAHEARGQRGV